MSSDWKLGDIVTATFSGVWADCKIEEVAIHAGEGDPVYQVRPVLRVLSVEPVIIDEVIASQTRLVGYSGSAFRSADNGKTWTDTAGWTALQNFTWQVAEAENGDLFAATGSQTAGELGEIWRSRDRGASWTRVFQHASYRNMSSVIQADNGDLLATAATFYSQVGQFWRSQNGGDSWGLVGQTVNLGGIQAQMAKASSGALVAIMSRTVVAGAQVWRSTDDGASWAFAQALGPTRYVSDLIVLSDGSLLATGTATATGSAIWRSGDDGATWTSISGIPSGSRGLSLLETESGVVVCGTADGETWQSFTKGYTWQGGDVLHSSTPYVYSLVQLRNGDVLAGTDAGSPSGSMVFRSEDDGQSWSHFSTLAGSNMDGPYKFLVLSAG